MAERRLHLHDDAALEGALRGLAPAIAWPATGAPGGPDLAAAVRTTIETMPAPRDGRGIGDRIGAWWRPSARPARRALVLALVALLAVAAIAGAVGLGLPGLRLIFGEGPPAPTVGPAPATAQPGSASPGAGSPGAGSAGSGAPSAGSLGGRMGLGEALDAADPAGLDARAGFHVSLPADGGIGEPDSAWIDERKGGQVTLLWATRDDLPATLEPDVGLLVSQFRGTVSSGFMSKLIDAGTTVDPVQVAGHRGYWLQGDPHVFFWEDANGFVDDPRRWVGDVLLWSDGPITYRLETSLGRDVAIAIAESLR